MKKINNNYINKDYYEAFDEEMEAFERLIKRLEEQQTCANIREEVSKDEDDQPF